MNDTAIEPLTQQASKPNILSVTSTKDITSVEQLSARIVQCVKYYIRDLGKPPKLGTINRWFGIKAREFNTRTRDIVEDAVMKDELKIYYHKKATVIMDTEFVKIQDEQFADNIDELWAARDRLLDRAE